MTPRSVTRDHRSLERWHAVLRHGRRDDSPVGLLGAPLKQFLMRAGVPIALHTFMSPAGLIARAS